MNEADTRDIVKAMIGDILGYDPFFEVTGEFSIKGQYADFAVKAEDNAIRFFVEVKSIDTKLDDKHLFQVIGYAANHGVEWAVLTNADAWHVYRLFAGQERKTERVLCIQLSSTPSAELVEHFFMFSKEGFRQNALHSLWSNLQALNPQRIAATLCEEAVITALRREVQKDAGMRLNDEAIRTVVLNQVIRGDLADLIKASDAKRPKAKPKAEEPK